MIHFRKSLDAWNQPDFEAVFKQEVRDLEPESLPLTSGLTRSNSVVGSEIDPVIYRADETEGSVCIKAGIFYSGVIAGSCCADDPTPPCEQTEYCELQFDINKRTAQVTIVLLESEN